MKYVKICCQGKSKGQDIWFKGSIVIYITKVKYVLPRIWETRDLTKK